MTKIHGGDQTLPPRAAGALEKEGVPAPHPLPPQEYAPYEPYEDTVDLWELMDTLWRRKWIVILCVLMSVGAATAYILTATPLYEISMQVRPGITGYNGNTPVRGWTPDDLDTWVKNQHYRMFFPRELLDGKDIPRITSNKLRGANFVTLSLFYPDPEVGKAILDRLFSKVIDYYVNQGGDRQIRSTQADITKKIQDLLEKKDRLDKIVSQELELSIKERKEMIQLHAQNIQKLQAKRQTELETLQQLEERVQAVLTNTSDLIKLRDKMIVKVPANDLSLLLYTNIIQQNIQYVSQLQERIAAIKKSVLETEGKENEIAKAIQDAQRDITGIETKIREDLSLQKQAIDREIQSLREQMAALTPVEKLSDPYATMKPVKPNKLMALTLAVFIGGFLGITAAFLVNAYSRRKDVSIQQE